MPRQLTAAWLFAALFPIFLDAQNSPLNETEWQELIEQIAKRNLHQPDFDVAQLTAHLENWLENPLDLNRFFFRHRIRSIFQNFKCVCRVIRAMVA